MIYEKTLGDGGKEKLPFKNWKKHQSDRHLTQIQR